MGKLFRMNSVVRMLGLTLAGVLLVATALAADAQDDSHWSLYAPGRGEPVLLNDSSLGSASDVAVPLPSGNSERTVFLEEPSVDRPMTSGATGTPDDSWLQDAPEAWTWQVLPSGLIYHSYLAGAKEPRISTNWVYERDWGWIWESTLGGRVGLLRYGTSSPGVAEGFQLDLEGAAQPRLDIEHKEDLIAADFRFGVPITYGNRQFQTKVALYHLSSHMGDEYMIRLHSLDRINYSRNVLVWGNSYYWTDAIRLYAEAGWAFYNAGGSEPWEFQFGIEYAPREPTGCRPVPFIAINSHLRQEVDYGGNLVVQSGWAWRGVRGQLFRMGMQYYTGKSDQYELFNQFEDKLGLGLWYDF